MEEIKKSGLTFEEARNLVDISIRDVKDGFVATGYYLWVIREERLWEDDGYNSFPEFLHCQYQKDKSWASRCIGLYEKFGKQIESGQLPVLAEPYRDYSVSQLIEMVSMTEEQREQVTPGMKVREIRELKPKREKKAKEPKEALPEEEDQLPGQISLEDCTAPVATVATREGQEGAQEAEEQLKEAEPVRIAPEPEKGQETAQEPPQEAGEPDGNEAAGVCAYRKEFSCTLTRDQQTTVGGNGNCHVGCCWECASREGCKLECISSASREEAGAEEEPLSAHGTPKKVYPEGSLIAIVGCESKPDGPKGGYNCFSCARECETRQEDCYCIEAPLGMPYPCETMDVVETLRDAMGNRCQFVNLDLAYRSQGNQEPVPCCKNCKEFCPFRCGRGAKGIAGESETVQTEEALNGTDSAPDPGEMKIYDRDSLMSMISNAEYMMKIMGEDWMRNAPGEYTKKAMEIQAYRNLLAEHDAAEASEPGLVENPDQGQPDLPNFRNDDQRKSWIKDYKAWGLWYRDEHIDVNYYKFDFPNGSRLVAVEYLQRESIWNSGPYDDVVYHLIEKNKQKYGCMTTYDDKFQYHGSCETELVKYLKKIQKKGGKE